MILSILNLPTTRPDPKSHGALGVFEQLLADIVEAHSLFQEQPLPSAVCEKPYVCLLPFYLCRATIDLTLISYGFCRGLACVGSYRRHSYSIRDGSG